MKNRQVGFNLIEMLVVVAIVGILASMAVPSFRSMYVRRVVQAAADALVSDIRLARSEAVKRSARTVVCRSTTYTDCANATGSWGVGWIVFVDVNGNGAVDAGEIVRIQQEFSNIASIQSTASPGSTLHRFTFEPTGWAKGANQTFNITPSGSDGASFQRLVCVSPTGRAALRLAGVATC